MRATLWPRDRHLVKRRLVGRRLVERRLPLTHDLVPPILSGRLLNPTSIAPQTMREVLASAALIDTKGHRTRHVMGKTIGWGLKSKSQGTKRSHHR
jgi:hypothetical protein